MYDPPPSRHGSVDTDSGKNAGAPRWVKVSGIIAVVVVLLLVVLHLAGVHHAHGGDAPLEGQRPPSSVTEEEHGVKRP